MQVASARLRDENDQLRETLRDVLAAVRELLAARNTLETAPRGCTDPADDAPAQPVRRRYEAAWEEVERAIEQHTAD
jgi:hypothetical protein